MNITQLLDELGIQYRRVGEHHHATSKYQAQIDCPHCSPRSGKFRMGVNASFCTCWSCGPHRLGDTLAALTNQTIGQLWPLIKGITKEAPKAWAPQGKLVLPKRLGPLQEAHKAYLRWRGFDPDEIVRLWRVQGLGVDGGRLAWRLFIPVYMRGEVVTWTTRTIGRQPLVKRYVTATGAESAVPRNKVLYGADYARHAVMVCEGPMDVWAIGPGGVAVLGTSYSAEQVAMLARYPVRAVVFDSEPDAQRRARQLVDQLCAYRGETLNITLDAKDPATAPKKDIKKLRRMVGV